MLMDSSTADGNGLRIWKSWMPNKVKVFAWLFFRDRLRTRVNLHRKHVQPVDACSRCRTSSEYWKHAFFHCPYIAELWSRIGVNISNVHETEDLWSAHHPAAVCSSHWADVLLALLWRIWEARNNHVFGSELSCVRVVISRVCDDLNIWRYRLPVHSRAGLDAWRMHLVSSNCNAATASALDAHE
ncbi:hypothetical protein U9M48_030372 [Paspalum notatum var. saurae]|uniref:Reverse transcriptase zinc-binding domain-containing protein n=1 Tax=Paspalum notatum var. saurae TaxID=547442 RepID=A0AAQ3X2I7_PASNO